MRQHYLMAIMRERERNFERLFCVCVCMCRRAFEGRAMIESVGVGGGRRRV